MGDFPVEAFDAVLEAARADSPWAFERLYVAYRGPVHAYLRSQGVADPDDLHGECFLRVFRSLPGFAGPEPKFRSWVFAIAHNLVVDDRRARSRRPTMSSTAADENLLPVSPDAAGVALASLGYSELRTQVDGLPAAQRDVLLLRSVADLTVEQIARATGRSAGAVKQLQRRGLEALRASLTQEGVPL